MGMDRRPRGAWRLESLVVPNRSRLCRVVVVSEEPIVRFGWTMALAQDPHFVPLGAEPDAERALQLAETDCPDVFLMDVTIPAPRHVEDVAALRASCAQSRIIARTTFDEGVWLQQMEAAGVDRWLDATGAEDSLVASLRRVLDTDRPRTPSGRTPLLLSDRQKEVVQLVARGHSSREIGEALGISPRTAEHHREAAMRRLRVDSVPALAIYAVRAGLIDLRTG
jgi:DNA-binding NarL/FixJ family response regulator